MAKILENYKAATQEPRRESKALYLAINAANRKTRRSLWNPLTWI